MAYRYKPEDFSASNRVKDIQGPKFGDTVQSFKCQGSWICVEPSKLWLPTYVDVHGKLFDRVNVEPSNLAMPQQMNSNTIDPTLLSICNQSGVSLLSVFPGFINTLMPSALQQQQQSSLSPEPSPGVQDAMRKAFLFAFANTLPQQQYQHQLQLQQQHHHQLQLLNSKPSEKKRKRKRKKVKKIMPVRSKSFRDVRPYRLETRARILVSCLFHWFWGVDQLNPFIDSEIIFQKMMIIPRTRQIPSPCEDENCTLRRVGVEGSYMFKYDRRHRDALRRVILGIEEKDDEKENKIERKEAVKKKMNGVKRKRTEPYVLPKGWTAIVRQRKNSSNYKIYIDPEGKRHRTRPPSANVSEKKGDALTACSTSSSSNLSDTHPKKKKTKKKKTTKKTFSKIKVHDMPVPIVSKERKDNVERKSRPVSASGKEMGFRNDSELPSNWKVVIRKRGVHGGMSGTYKLYVDPDGNSHRSIAAINRFLGLEQPIYHNKSGKKDARAAKLSSDTMGIALLKDTFEMDDSVDGGKAKNRSKIKKCKVCKNRGFDKNGMPPQIPYMCIGSPSLDAALKSMEHDENAESVLNNIAKQLLSTNRNAPRIVSTASGKTNQWAQCSKCEKWRTLPPDVKTETLPDMWTCEMNIWDPVRSSCKVEEEPWDASEVTVRDTKDMMKPQDIKIGEHYDGWCNANLVYYPCKVMDERVNQTSGTRQIKIHFKGWQPRFDEWIDETSGRIYSRYSKLPKS